MHSQVIHGGVALPRFGSVSLGQLRHLIPLGFVGLISWSVWLLRFLLLPVFQPAQGGGNAAEGGGGGQAADRVPAVAQRVGAGGGLDDRRAVPGSRAGAVAGGGGGVPVGADGGLPAGGGAAGAGAPGGRVLPGPAVRGRR